MQSGEDVKEKFLNMYYRMLDGDFAPAQQLVSPEFVCTNPRRPNIEGIDHMIRAVAEQRDALEGMSMEVLFAYGSQAGFSLAYVVRGRHVKELFGVPPSGRHIEAMGLTMHELVDGTSVSGWSCSSIVEKLKAAYEQARAEGSLPSQTPVMT